MATNTVVNPLWMRLLLRAPAVASLLPAIVLTIYYYGNYFKYDPWQQLIQQSGFWAMWLLLCTLAISPLRRMALFWSHCQQIKYGRRLSDWNPLIRQRRLLGLATFCYATAHLWFLLLFNYDLQLSWFSYEVQQKIAYQIGVASFWILLLLTITSFKWSMQLLGHYWRTLHKLTYVAAILTLGHFWLLVPDGEPPLIETLALLMLLGYRLLQYTDCVADHPAIDGLEVDEASRCKPVDVPEQTP